MENKATKRTNRLGRGLSALIPDISTEIDKKYISKSRSTKKSI